MTSEGIITSIDSNSFLAFQLFYYGLKKYNSKYPLLVFDIGLSNEEKKWMQKKSINLVKYNNPIVSKKIFMWQTWNKPDYIFRSPFDYTLWLDSDTVIYNKLDEIFKLIKKQVTCFRDFCGIDITNKKELYELFPVKERLDYTPNGGVLGICKTRKKDINFLNKYLFLTKKASKSKKIRDLLSWWDQGAIIWALEKSNNAKVVINDLNYNDVLYDPSIRIKDPIILYEKLRNRKSSIVHLVGCPKPYFWFEKNLDRSEIEKNIKIFITGHDKQCLEKVDKEFFLEKVNLSKLDICFPNTEDLAENRLFLSEKPFRNYASYIGIITHRYKEKYNLDIKNLLKLDLQKNIVYTCHIARKDWFDHSLEYHPGIEKYLREISLKFNLPIRKKHVFWANNFICHKSIFAEFINLFKQVFNYMHKKYGYNFDYKVDEGQEHRKAAFLYERISMMYFSNQDNLKIIQIPYAKSGFDQIRLLKSNSSSSMSLSNGISQ